LVSLTAVRPCKGSSGAEVTVEEDLHLVIPAAARRLREAGYDVTDAGVLLVVRDDPRITIYPSGRMLVHTDDLGRARDRALGVLAALGRD
jgi:hypothetical protein